MTVLEGNQSKTFQNANIKYLFNSKKKIFLRILNYTKKIVTITNNIK